MPLEKKAATMCALQLLNNYPHLLKQERATLEPLRVQIIALFSGMDEETAQACLKEYPTSNPTLTAFRLNEWLKGRQKRPMAVPYYRDDDDWKPPTEAEKDRCRRQVAAFKAGKDVRNV